MPDHARRASGQRSACPSPTAIRTRPLGACRSRRPGQRWAACLRESPVVRQVSSLDDLGDLPAMAFIGGQQVLSAFPVLLSLPLHSTLPLLSTLCLSSPLSASPLLSDLMARARGGRRRAYQAGSGTTGRDSLPQGLPARRARDSACLRACSGRWRRRHGAAAPLPP